MNAKDTEPLPNLAKGWEWSQDGHKLTMHLVKGAKWSDGVPFNADDVMFYWEDAVLDPNVSPLGGGASPEAFGEGTTLKRSMTIRWSGLSRPLSRSNISTPWLIRASAPDRRIF